MNVFVCGLFSTAESYGRTSAALEIIIMLLVAFLLGYLFRYFLGNSKVERKWKEKYDDLLHRYQLLENKLKMFEAENQRLKAELDACEKNLKSAQTTALGLASMPAAETSQTAVAQTSRKTDTAKDDLKIVEGIGPKIEKMLNEAGIYTWEQLADTPVEKLEAILEKGGPAYKVHNPQSWPFQARLAAQGKWKELKKWQDEHKWGRF